MFIRKILALRAAALRHSATRPERRFARMFKTAWPDIKLMQQHVIKPYIVDFYIPSHKLVIEIDGGQHAESLADKKRDKTLTKRGLKVIRFWNNDVMENIEGCYEIINPILGQAPRN